MGKEISIVVPVYNEAGILENFFNRTISVMKSIGCSYEIVSVDDGSDDFSVQIIRHYAELYPAVVIGIFLEKNCGQHIAIMAGLFQCCGEKVITIDADLQNPPEEIPRMLSSQMNRIDFFIERRKEIARKYREALCDIPEITMQRNLKASNTCLHIFVLRLNLKRLCCTRREFFDAMDAENIHCNVQYLPVYLHPYYRQLGYREGLCPETEKLYREIITIPLYPRMTDRDVCDVICGIKKVTDAYRK